MLDGVAVKSARKTDVFALCYEYLESLIDKIGGVLTLAATKLTDRAREIVRAKDVAVDIGVLNYFLKLLDTRNVLDLNKATHITMRGVDEFH